MVIEYLFPLTSGTFKITSGTLLESFLTMQPQFKTLLYFTSKGKAFVARLFGRQTGVQGHPGKQAYIVLPGVHHVVFQTLAHKSSTGFSSFSLSSVRYIDLH